MEASDIIFWSGPNIDREENLQDYLLYLEEQVVMMRALLTSLISRHPELFSGPEVAHWRRTGALGPQNNLTSL